MAERGFLFVGNALCVDFVNTEIMSGGERVDLLEDFEALSDWLEVSSAVDAATAGALRERWAGTREGAAATTAARDLRAAIRRFVEGGGRRADERVALETINAALGVPARGSRVRATRGEYVCETVWEFRSAADVLAPIAESARDLLCSGRLALVRKCRSDACILHFVDTTKNRKRAWCSMDACGNRTKVAAHYRRTRDARA